MDTCLIGLALLILMVVVVGYIANYQAYTASKLRLQLSGDDMLIRSLKATIAKMQER